MAEYISREKAIEAIMDLPNCPNGYSDTYDKACIIGTLEEVPTADVVEVVRCKDCIHYWKNWKDGEPDYGDEVAMCLCSPKDDAFCSEGERRKS